jgi:hypothetical protein
MGKLPPTLVNTTVPADVASAGSALPWDSPEGGIKAKVLKVQRELEIAAGTFREVLGSANKMMGLDGSGALSSQATSVLRAIKDTRRTLAPVQKELELVPADQPVAAMIREANATVGLESSGTIPAQAAALVAELLDI